MLIKLALRNIRKSLQDYSIYFFTLVIAVAIFYIFNSMEAQEVMLSVSSAKTTFLRELSILLGNLSLVISVILGFLIVYANNFLVKRRKKEIWLYLLLGMSKSKVSSILTLETVIVGLFSLLVGLIVGIISSQGLSFVIVQLFQVDMSQYSFIFSSSAVLKTLLYFGVIFLLVMVFTVFILSKYKLIDLLNAKRKNETLKIRNKTWTFLLFLLAIGLLGYAYASLISQGILGAFSGTQALSLMLCGIVGTYLLFLSGADFLLWLAQKSKTFYYKGLTMFVLRQLTTNINTNVASMTIISLLLLFTIGILSASISLAGVLNSDMRANNLSDFTLHSTYFTIEGTQKADLSSLTDDPRFATYVQDFFSYTLYTSEDITFTTLLTPTVKQSILSENPDALFSQPLSLMKESDFQQLMNFFHQPQLALEITASEYLIATNNTQMMSYYLPTLQEQMPLLFQGQELKPANTSILVTALENSNGVNNIGILIVDDSLLAFQEQTESRIVGNYFTTQPPENIESAFRTFIAEKMHIKESSSYALNGLLSTRLAKEAESVGTSAIITFLGLYIGIIFAICCVTILAIKQLSETADNKERYQVLRKLGADERLIQKSLLTQIGLFFLLPLVVALLHSIVGLQEVNKLVATLGNIDIARNILLTTCFIVLVYGGYFVATCVCSKGIIKEKRVREE